VKDALGMTIKEGDYVAFLNPGSRDLSLGLISRFTAKRVGVKPVNRELPAWHKASDRLLFPESVVRLDQDQAFLLSMSGSEK